MKSLDIRKKFFDYFIKHGHEKVASSSLIPAQDPTLLFINAGMNQFKDLFLGNESRKYKTATTVQKCVRAGGKHNDLDNVGFTKRHLTFFEMMGNFSFGDYFKKEAIPFAWDLLVNGYGLKPEDMYVSVYKDDQESYDIWANDIGVPKERIMRFDKKDNFWQMGDTGPCGPCTEIYLDQRTTEERKTAPVYDDFEEGRLLEVWNLVFMQYNQQENGELVPLKQTGVDTGVGIERLASVLQKKDSVFGTDLFAPLLKEIEKLTGVNYTQSTPEVKAAFHVLADHVRSSSLIIADGGSPSNEGRGYVLRKIIRRAALFAQKLTSKNIFPQLATCFIKDMGPIYPELTTNEAIIVSLLKTEIEQFAHNLVRGQTILEGYFKDQKKNNTITGEQAFKLYDTYGFPLEVTMLASKEHGFKVDSVGFEKCMEQQRALSGKKMKKGTKQIEIPESVTTEFVGYQKTNTVGNIVGLVVNGKMVEEIKKDQDCLVITDVSPFFAAMGGQVSDSGWITFGTEKADVLELEKLNNARAIGARIKAPTAIKIGDKVEQQVNVSIRRMTMNNHTGTHLLQSALIELLGKQVKQSGSVVTPDYLRFDFTYHKNLTPEQIKTVEDRVNEKIMENIPVDIFETSYKKAVEKGVIAIFGEKYNPEKVRVIDVPGFSAELCGGTHVPSTGVIGPFKITEVTALSAGNRRIFAVTGPRAVELMQRNFSAVKNLSQKYKVKPEEVIEAVEKQDKHLHTLQQELKNLKKQALKAQLPVWEQQVKEVNGVPFLYLLLENYSVDQLKDVATHLNNKQPGFYVLVSNTAASAVFYAQCDAKHEKKIDMKAFAKTLQDTGLRGGGKKGTLQGGGKKITKDLSKLCIESIS